MNERIRWIVTTGALAAIEIVLYILGLILKVGLININLSLVPIAVGALLLGPWCGLFLGFINGIAAILSPDTMVYFMPQSVFGTILICLIKSMAAGFFSGLLFQAFKNRKLELFGMVLCSILIPIINTSIFTLGCFTFFRDWLFANAGEINPFLFLVTAVIGWNFVFEISISAIFSPAICKIVKIARRKQEATS